MSNSDETPYPFTFNPPKPMTSPPNSRGAIPSPQTSHLRTMMLEAYANPTKILAFPCSYDGLSSRLIEEAGFPMLFLSGFAVSSSHGLPDTGYIAMAEMCEKIQETVRVTSLPVMVDGDTGYGSPMNVRRTVESFAATGAAGVMIEDQTWPKRCGHTKGKSVVSRGEAYARIQAACDARDEGRDIFILARTDALIHGWGEAMARAHEFKRIGADAVFVEALPDKDAMKRCMEELKIPMLANIIEGGMTENLSAKELAGLGFAAVAYPWTLVAAKLKAVRDALDGLKKSMVDATPPPMILGYDEVCKGVGFNKYWMPQKVFILIYKGDPLDYAEYRHTALYFHFASSTRTILHIIGCPGLFRFVKASNVDPSTVGELAKVVPVTEIPTDIGEEAIVQTVERTPIRNGRDDLDWNCQNWVGDALKRLVERGWIEGGTRDEAIEKMVEGCLEAGDEGLPVF
ncbi:Pyruvate/Phosphoenolpyruvate kinase-like domain-containing protein [Aspergillus karnatakaensis]|uniref:Pyruvate/Phosphoenolpyruvate kinase-like domain-containing protein n=1 Tax=Aspergillus karnatakaensis TaxID=1810916 RepID=UPI003CCD3996